MAGCMVPGLEAQLSSPRFEVSTVRPGDPDAQSSNLNTDVGLIRASNLPVLFLLQFAFGLNAGSTDQIIGAPAWVLSKPFNIVAKTDEATAAQAKQDSPDERNELNRQMIRLLLEDRFQLKVHHERRELPVLVLTIAKKGSKLRVSTEQASATHWSGLHNPEPGLMEGSDAPVALLVNALSSKHEIDRRLIVDKTGLTGKYDFTLKWTPDNREAAGDLSESGPSLFTAVEEQLGLKLESAREPVDCIVIDHIEQPSAN